MDELVETRSTKHPLFSVPSTSTDRIELCVLRFPLVSSLTFSHRNESESRGDAFDEEENKGGREEAGLSLK